MPRGASPKREREYEELKERFAESGRHPGREKEVAARIVNKQRRQYGETKGQQRRQAQGDAPDKDLPIDGYQHLTVNQVKGRIGDLDDRKLRTVRRYEERHKQRKTLLQAIDKRLQG